MRLPRNDKIDGLYRSSYLVIARATRERRQWTSSDRRQRRRKGAKKLAPHLQAGSAEAVSIGKRLAPHLQAGSAEAFSIGLRLGRHLVLHKQSAGQNLSANPEISG